MKLLFKDERVLAVVAHPDDADLLCAGTLARAKAEGAAIAICVMCQGDKGQPRVPVRNLAAMRREEMEKAAGVLGAKLFRCGCPDSELTDHVRFRTKLVQIYRTFKPTLVLAHAPCDYHPDHCAASALAQAASWFCGSRGQRSKLPPLASPPALWWMDTLNMSGFEPTLFVDIQDYLEIKNRMLLCHRSQVARGADGDFYPLAQLMKLQAAARGMQSDVPAAEAFRTYNAFKRTRAW